MNQHEKADKILDIRTGNEGNTRICELCGATDTEAELSLARIDGGEMAAVCDECTVMGKEE